MKMRLGARERLDRFLVLGSDAGAYFASARPLEVADAAIVLGCLADDGPRTVARIAGISRNGGAPRNDPAIFALALAASADDVETRREALAALPRVARTGADLFHFVEAVGRRRGWGRGLRRGLAAWYLSPTLDDLVCRVLQSPRNGRWRHRDLLRLSHPETDDPARRAAFEWICRGTVSLDLPARLRAASDIERTKFSSAAARLVRTHALPLEAVPAKWLHRREVWSALAERMSLRHLLRDLGRLSAVGLFRADGPEVDDIEETLGDVERLHQDRLHPVAFLLEERRYARGRDADRRLWWHVAPRISGILNSAFRRSFRAVEPTGRRIMLALDTSWYMDRSEVGETRLSPREISAAMALVMEETEPRCRLFRFANGLKPLRLRLSDGLEGAVRVLADRESWKADCALPMLHAMDEGLKVDAFVVCTASYAPVGDIPPVEALREYRRRMGIPAKLVTIGMAPESMAPGGIRIADPDDAGMLDVVGFDAAVPALVADFVRG